MKKYKADEEFTARKFVDEVVLVPFGSQIRENNSMIILNETSAFLWNELKEEKSIEQLVSALKKEYDAEDADVYTDVINFIDFLQKINAVKTIETE